MANNLGRISGQLLKDNLTRNGHDLSFHAALLTGDDPVLKLNVTNRYVSINTDSTSKDLFVNSVTHTNDLIIDPVSLNGLQGKSSLKVSISGNTIVSTQDLNLSAATQVNANIIDTDNIRIDNRVISTTTLNTNLDLTPAGSLEIYNDLNVTGNLWAKETAPGNGTGKITLDGNITFGSTDQSGANADTISFAADINTDINPNLDATYRLGSNTRTWDGLYTELINGEQASTLGLLSSGVNLVLRPGKIWYVATNGLDSNVGNHQSSAFATIKHALNEAQSGDTVHIYPGTYTEITPLVVKQGVTVKGTGIRSVTVVPDATTSTENVFLLNGETMISELSVKDFYAPGYAFAFAPGFTVSTRSPYVQNITVITKGSVTSPSDPRGFDQGDAGGGAYVDGSLATSSSKEASMLFHSVTFITPGVDALVMNNGVRVEWLNSFTYFANRGLYATQGTLGLASLGVRFGAEIRSIGSANVYGNYGAEVNGASTLMYLIQHNFAYIGAGKDVTNDPSLNIEENETVELAAGKIYYQSLDNRGNFRVGDAFSVSFDTGLVAINGVSVSAGGVTSINFANGTDETHVDATNFHTGNIKFSSNLLTTLSGALNLDSGTNEINLNANTDITDSLDVTGNLNIDGTLTIGNAYIDIVRFTAPVEFALRPKTDDDYSLGGPTNKRWDKVYLDTSYIGSYKLENATISTLPTDADVELRANSTGKIYIPTNNVEIDNDLTVHGTTNFGDNVATLAATVTGTIDHTGLLDRTGDTGQTGTYNQTGYLDVSSDVQIANVTFIDNTISTVTLDSNLELGAASTGKILIPSANVKIDHNLVVTSDIHAGSVGVTTDITTDSYSNGNIEISLDLITTTLTDSDLEFRAAGTGKIYASQDSVKFDQNLTVDGTTNLKNVSILPIVLPGGPSGSAQFSGSNYLSVAGGAGTAMGTGDFTWECWVYPTASSNYQAFIDTRTTPLGGGDTTGFYFGTNFNTITPMYYTNGLQLASSIDLTLNDWNHVALTRASGNVTIWVNGASGGTYTGDTTNLSQQRVFIGSSGLDLYLTGRITNLRIVKGTPVYTIPFTPLTTALTAIAGTQLLLLEDTIGNLLKDSSTNNFTVTNNGLVTWSALSPVVGGGTTPSNITHIGNYYQTGDTLQTGNRGISSTLDVDSNAYFDSMSFVNNTIATTDADTDLQLKAALTGIVDINDNATFDQNLRVNSTTYTNGITNSNTTTSDTFSDGDIEISTNNIKTTVGSNDLRLLAAGTGIISVPNDAVEFNQNLTVNGTTSVKNTIIGTGGLTPVPKTLTLTGDYLQTGDTLQTGNRSISSELQVHNNAYFDSMSFVNNVITTTDTDTDLSLKASGTGLVVFDENTTFSQGLSVATLVVNGLTNSGITTAGTLFDNDIQITSNIITTTVGNNNLRLLAAGTGIISVPNDAVEFNNNLTVNTNTSLKNTVIGTGVATTQVSQNISGTSSPTGSFFYGWQIVTPGQTVPTFSVIQPGWTVVGQPTWVVSVVGDGVTNYDITITGGVFASGGTYSFTGPLPSNLTLTGNYLQTGNTLQTGNRSISAQLLVQSNAYFDSMSFVTNTITTTDTNTDLSLKAAGTGLVVFDENTTFSQRLTASTLVTNGLTNSGTITSDIFTDGDIEINDNYITTTVGSNDLRLVPNGSGKLSIPLDPVAITQALTVQDASNLKNVTINGDIDHLGNTTQTGNVVQTGDFDLSNTLTVTGTDAFFTDVRIINNRIATSTGNNNLELRANGTAIIKIADSATLGQTLTVNGITTTSTISAVTGTITSDIFSDSDIEINDNYITTTVGNNNLILAGNTTGGPKLEKIKFNSNVISTETTNEGITLTVPSGSVTISAATALKIPVGTTVNRPTLTQGEFRFNTTDNLFRGYSTSTVSFAGVYSADRRTSVLAHPTNNTLLFTTNTLNNMTVSSTGLTVNSLTVDNNLTFVSNIISTAVTNNSLYLTPNGTGKVVIDDVALRNDEIINSANAALVIQNAGNGYVKFSGTGGLALPAGPTVVDTTGVELGDLRYNTDLSIPEIFNGIDYVGFVSENAALLNAAEVQEITNLWALVIG